MRLKSHYLALALVFVFAAGFRLRTLNRPFFDDAEGAGCQIGVLARNYLRFPWTETHGMPVLSSGPAGAGGLVFYPDHPPMLPLMVAPFYAAFGVGAWQTRLPIAITTLATIFLLYRLLAAFGSPRIGLLAAAIFAAAPITLYFGGFPDVVGIPLIFFVLLTVLAYLRFHRRPQPMTFAGLLGAFVLAGLCDWPAYVLVPVLAAHFIATRPRREWRWIAAFASAACLLFAATYLYITLATGSPWSWMAPLFRRRSSLVGATGFTLRQWVGKALAVNGRYQSAALLIAAALWLILRQARLRQRAAPATTVGRLLLAWAILYIIIGSKALYSHPWAWLPLTPWLAIAGAQLIDWVLGTVERVRTGSAAAWVAGALVAIFATFTARATLADLYSPTLSSPYTPMELAAALRAAAPGARDVAMLFGVEAKAQFWFYGDRPIRVGIWAADDFEQRLDDDTVDTMYNFDVQPWKARATGFVFPKMWEDDFAPLRRYLSARYPLARLSPELGSKFDVFDLQHPLASSAAAATEDGRHSPSSTNGKDGL